MFKRVMAVGIVALVAAPSAFAGGPTMTIGATEDIVKQPTLVAAKAQMDKLKLAGLRGVRMTQEWAPGQTEPGGADFDALKNAVAAAQLDGVQVILSVTNHGSRTTPLSDQDQSDFTTYAANVARALPYVREYVVGNEPNLNRYWLPQFGLDGSDVAAPAYESLLAKTYDALKAVSPKITVLGGAVSPRGIDRPNTGRDTHSPTAFITDMGAAYKASGRTTPIMDEFAFHPYGDNSSQPPDFQHPSSTSIGLGDYGKLVALLGAAFDGTAQPGSTLPIVYDEYGVETDLDRWQSGLYYADGTPKTSLAPTRAAVQEARRGVIAHCTGLRLPVKAKLDRASARNPRFSFRLSCDIDCAYRARLERLPQHSTVMVKRGVAVGGKSFRVAFAPRKLAPGRYRFTVRVTASVNPGEPRSLFGAAFRIL